MPSISIAPYQGGSGEDNSLWQSSPLADASGQPDLGKARNAISGIESGGNYGVIGPVTKSGDRALGKYQVMAANVPQWTREALGRELTPREFLADPEAQDAVFNHKFGGYVSKYGPEGASKAWFAGEKGMNNPNAKDILGTSVDGYASKFMNAYGGEGAKQPQVQQPSTQEDWWSSSPLADTQERAVFADRFGGPKDFAPSSNAKKVAEETQRLADNSLIGSSGNEVPAALDTFVNTALLNLPRNAVAGINSLVSGRSFGDEYAKAKAESDAMSRQNPKSSLAGTVGGAVAGAALLPQFGGAATVGGRALQAAANAGLYGGASEFFDSKDPVQAAKAAGIGAAAGAVMSPVIDKTTALITRMRRKPADFVDDLGQLTPMARKAVEDAGIDPSLLQSDITRMFAEKGVSPAAAREASLRGFGIPASRGQLTGNVADQQFEQAAARGGYGDRAQSIINDMYRRQGEAVKDAKTAIQGKMAGGAQPVDDAIDAAGKVISGVRSEAGKAKQAYNAAYENAYAQPGGVNAVVFDGMSLRIRNELTNRTNPIEIYENTPAARQALNIIDEASSLRAPKNLADPGGHPSSTNILEVSLRGAEQVRKRLVATARSAANPEDRRAVSEIIRKYDNEIVKSADDGLFSGSDKAIEALKTARGMYADYAKMFKVNGKGDDVGRAINRIVETDAQASEVANLLFGKASVGEKGVSIRVADRLNKIFGPGSEEMAAIKQGLWNRLTSKPDGVEDFGPQALGNRIMKFLNGDGRELASRIYTPEELDTMRRFASSLRVLVPNRNATNPSGTGGTLMSIFRNAASGQNVGTVALAALGYQFGGWETAATIGSIRIGKGMASAIKTNRMVKQAVAGSPKVVNLTADQLVYPTQFGTAAGLYSGQ